jgi:glycosyltransferase involved in cell wall biosynthesis
MQRSTRADAETTVPGNPRPQSAGETRLTVVSLAAVTWNFRLVGRTRMLTEAWLQDDQPTVFVQIPSLRTGLQRLAARFAAPTSVPVLRPWPTVPACWWSRLGVQHLERAIRRRAAGLRRELDRQIRWEQAVAIVISPVWAPWLDELPFRHVVYDCIDELAVHVPRPELAPLFRDWEERLIRRIDGAVVTAQALGDGLRARRPDLRVALIRNGVDVERFQSLAASTPRPVDVPILGRPVVGFVGALYEWIDWELIRDTARQAPELEFVFVGPRDRRAAGTCLAGLPNVRLLGPRPYDRVPAYLDAFDVCWVPFKQNAVGQAANPVKIYEYLALGKPVVTTPVADTESFGTLVQVARTPGEMAAQLRAAAGAAPTSAPARIEFARRNSWQVRAREYVAFLAALARSPVS